jgi:uncharacterized protein YjbJ (UPF0337 family)
MSDNNQQTSSSSADSWANTAAGAVREGVAKVTGNPHDQAAAKEKKGKFAPETHLISSDLSKQQWDNSHETARLGSATVTDSGVHIDNQDRREGQWKETVGSAKESVGSLLGSTDLQQSGREQAQEGKHQSTIGQATEWISGSMDRLRGK